MTRHTYTTQRQVRAAFWSQHPQFPRRLGRCGAIPAEYPTDTRCAFADWVDALARNGEISQALAQRVTLS